MSISSYLGVLASSSEAVAKGLANKHPFLSVTFFMLSGFFWAGEALTQKPAQGRTYWQNIQHNLKIRFDANQTLTMKWALGAGVFTMLAAGTSLAALIVGAGPLSWLGIATVALGIATATSWYQASKWDTTSGSLNKLAAGSQFTYVALSFAAVFAPAVTILGVIATAASYISTTLWFFSYPAKGLVEDADTWKPAQNAVHPAPQPEAQAQVKAQDQSHTRSPQTIAYHRNGQRQWTFTTATLPTRNPNSRSLDQSPKFT